MRAQLPLPKTDTESVELSSEDRQIIDFPVFDVSPASSPEPVQPEAVRKQLLEDVALLIEEKHTVVQLSANAMQRLAATNQLATANLGMMSCNATESGRVIEASIGAVAGRISALRASAEVQSLMVGALVSDIRVQTHEHSELVEASVALEALAHALQSTVGACRLEPSTGTSMFPAPVAELVMSTIVAVQDIAARIRSLDHAMRKMQERGQTLQDATDELGQEATGGEADCVELKAANRIVTSLVGQMDLMIQPMRQIAQSCSSVHANLAMTADGLLAIQARLFEAMLEKTARTGEANQRLNETTAFL